MPRKYSHNTHPNMLCNIYVKLVFFDLYKLQYAFNTCNTRLKNYLGKQSTEEESGPFNINIEYLTSLNSTGKSKVPEGSNLTNSREF